MTTMTDAQLICQIRETPDSLALVTLFRRYRPVLARLQRTYFIPGADQADWEQEGLLVLHAVAQRFDLQRPSSFGAFYRLNLQHRIIDLIRHSRAKKRHAATVSLDAHSGYFADTLVDLRPQIRERLEVQDSVRNLLPRLSGVERVVFNGLAGGLTPEDISHRHRLALSKVQAAVQRSRQKLRASLAE